MADLASKTVVQLQALCKEKGIKGYSGKKKGELITLLQPPLAPVVEVKVEEPKPEPKPKTKTKAKSEPKSKPKEKLQITEVKNPKPKTKVKSKPIPFTPIQLPPCPTFPHILGFEDEAKILHQWLSNPPSMASLFGPTGIGKTYFVEEFFKALQYKVIESPTDELPDILYTPSYISKKVVLMDNAEKPPKLSNQTLLTHLLVIGRDKLTAPIQMKMNKPSVTSITKYLQKRYPKQTKEQLQEVIEEHNQDLRHILLTLESGFQKATSKDETVNKDAWQATAKLYDTQIPFDTRMAFAEIETDFVSHLVQDGIPKATFDMDSATRALDQLSTTDITRHTTGKLSMLVATVSKLDQAKPYVPFIPFPSWYGKYSKREKHKRFLNGKRLDIEAMGVLRASLLDKANDLANEGKSMDVIAKECISLLQKYRLQYDDLFEMYDEFLYEGSEVDECIPELAKKIKELEKAFD